MIGKKRKCYFKSGYAKVFLAVNRGFNFLLSLVLIILSTPLFLLISGIIKLQDDGDVLYRGTRLGLHKNPFTIYKFRTLIPEAQTIIGPEVLNTKHKKSALLTRSGKFLRDSRLDELPQLFNILIGDMDFVGPRPQRPEIYEKIGRHIKGYDHRFLVKPGLIGFPQLFLPHSAPKRIQSIVDNKYVKIKQKFTFDIVLILFTICVVSRIIFSKTYLYLWNSLFKAKILKQYAEKRLLERVRPKYAKIFIETANYSAAMSLAEGELIDINEEAFLMYSNANINHDELTCRLEIDHRTNHHGKYKKKSALCHGTIYRMAKEQHGAFRYSYVIMYTPVSPFNYYIVHQYFLAESMV